MTAGAYVLGSLRLLGVVVPAGVIGVRCRAALLPGVAPALAALTSIVVAVSAVTVAALALGSVGQLRSGPLIALLVAGAVANVAAGWHRASRPAHRPTGGRPRRPGEVLAVAGTTGLVAAMWTTWVANAVDFGIGDSDSNWYHLPFAARFAQTGSTVHAQYVNAEALVPYYPANGSVLHAVGMVAYRSDLVSLFLNLALVPAVLLAAWCLGEGRGTGPASLVGVALVLTVPVIAESQAGTANDDLLSVLGLLAAAAFSVHPDLRPPPAGDGPRLAGARPWWAGTVLVGLAAGLAVGTKLTVLVPAAVLVAGHVVASGRGRRWASLWRAVAAAVVTGGYWYGRNVALVGNPLPSLRIGLPRPPVPSVDEFGSTLAQHLTDGAIWRHIFLPGLSQAFGVAWWVILAVTVTGLVLTLRRRGGGHTVVALAGLVALAAYTVTPGSAYGTEALTASGARAVVTNIFAYNTRYLLPALVLGLALLPVGAARWRRGAWVVLGAFGAVLVATQMGGPATTAWASGHQVAAAIAGAVVLAAVLAGLAGHAVFDGLGGLGGLGNPGGRQPGRARHQARRRLAVRWAAVAVAAAAVVAVVWPVEVRYQSRRDATSALAQWAGTVPGAHIAYAGFAESYDLYGPRLANRVDYLGQRGPHGGWHPFASCVAWRAALHLTGYDYLVVPAGTTPMALGYDLSTWRLGLPGGQPPLVAPATIWSETDPGLSPVLDADGAVVYRVAGPPSTSGCTS